MLHRIRNLFIPKGHFRRPRPSAQFSGFKIRPIVEADVSACEEIYHLNEPNRFPNDYFPKFSEWLRERQAYIVVVEKHGVVRAFGGVNAEVQGGHHFACLSFGMVHPANHRMGLGTALLFARLSLLQPSKSPSIVMLTTVGGSESFYSRFGFKFVRAIQATPDYLQQHHCVRVSANDKSLCAAALRQVLEIPALAESELPSFSNIKGSSVALDA